MIDDKDKALWQQALAGVTPLKKNNVSQHIKPMPVIKIKRPVASKNHINTEIITPVIDDSNIGNDSTFFSKSGVQPKIIKQMKRGKLPTTPPCLDLHGLTRKQAQQALINFIHTHQNQRFLHIIHGKGYHSKDGIATLKQATIAWLKNQTNVLAFCPCPDNYGGTGAMFVHLKRLR